MKAALRLFPIVPALFSLQLISYTAQAQACFAAAVNFNTNNGPNSVATGDFNGDGNADYAVANYSSSNISIRLGNGAGSFGANTNFSSTGTPYAVHSADLNGDNKIDLAIADYQGNVSIALGVGNGTFNAAVGYPAGNIGYAINSGDVNADGKPDLVVASYNDSISILLGNGSGGFGAPVNFETGHFPSSIEIADFNNDGKKDVAVLGNGSSDVSIHIGDGAGGFAARTIFSVGNSPHVMTQGDYNGDGNTDLATADGGSNSVTILSGNGSGSFTQGSFIAGSGPYAIVTSDFNADAKPDLAVINYLSNKVAVFSNTGSGSFSNAGIFNVLSGPCCAALADFNNDGKPDVVVGNYNANKASVLLGATLPSVSANVSPATTVCYGTPVTFNGSGASSYSWTGGVFDGSSIAAYSSQTYTVTGTTASGCTNIGTVSLVVNSLPTVSPYATVSAICQNSGDSSILHANNSPGSTVTWNPGNLTGDSIVVTPNSSVTYTVTSTDANSCVSSPVYVGITVNLLPNIIANATSNSVCAGGSVTLSGSGIVATPGTYTWTGGITNGVSFIPSGTVTYTVTGLDANGCSDTASTTVVFHNLPNVTANASATSICPGTNITLNGGGAATYTWLPAGVSNGVAFVPTGSGTYTVTGTDTNHCSNTASVSITVPVMVTPDICMVTVDSLSQNNLIIWDKTAYTNVDTFYVYRDTANNAFGLIGKVPYDSLSQFVDTVRTLYAANGDPAASSWRYKIAIKDTCGNLSPKSPYHQSIFMQNNSGNFTWSEYKIEGQSLPVPSLTNYLFKRDNTANGNFATIQTLSASSISYTDPAYATYQATADWRVETQWSTSCTATYKLIGGNGTMGAINTSRSNIKTNRATGIAAKAKSIETVIYPNPAKESITIELQAANATTYYEVVNAMGQQVLTGSIPSGQLRTTISVNMLNSGVYLLQIRNNSGQTVRKLIIE